MLDDKKTNVVSMGVGRMVCSLFARAVDMMSVANTHENYDDFKKDSDAALDVFFEAAALGDGYSQYLLGKSLYCRQKYDDAYEWLSKAIENECDQAMDALFLIAGIYEYGSEKVTRDLEAAMELYECVYEGVGYDLAREYALRIREELTGQKGANVRAIRTAAPPLFVV